MACLTLMIEQLEKLRIFPECPAIQWVSTLAAFGKGQTWFKKKKKKVYGQITAVIFPHSVVSRPNWANTDVLTVCQWVLPNCRLTLLVVRYKLEGKQSRETFDAHNCVWLEMAIGCWKYGLVLLLYVASNAAGNTFSFFFFFFFTMFWILQYRWIINNTF